MHVCPNNGGLQHFHVGTVFFVPQFFARHNFLVIDVSCHSFCKICLPGFLKAQRVRSEVVFVAVVWAHHATLPPWPTAA